MSSTPFNKTILDALEWLSLAWRVLLVVAGLAGFVAVRAFHRTRASSIGVGVPTENEVKASRITPGKTSASPREPGEWVPVPFNYPSVEACADEPQNIKPVPYRPFKWGEYHVTMGIRSMPWDEWIELDNEFIPYHRIREERIKTRGERVIRTLPATPGLVSGGHDAAAELVQELAEYLSRRFPTVYSVVRRKSDQDTTGWYGQASVQQITILPLGKTYNLDDEDPMVVSASLVQEDLAIMLEGSDGRYYLQAGAIVVPGMWRLQDKIGMSLEDIHISGTVPQFETKLQLSMSRFFKRLPVDKPVVRNNYSFQVVARPEEADAFDPDELAWAKTMKGDEDLESSEPGFLRAEGAADVDTGGGNFSEYSDLATNSESVVPANVRMRVERQTLRRLPRTGAIVFTIRTYLTPLEKLALEPDVPGRLASAIRSWPEDVARYKARPVFQSILEYLDKHHARQLEEGQTTGPTQ